MKKKWLAQVLIAGLLATSFPAGGVQAASLQALPAFPGAEGGGKYVTGGRAQAVYEVTTLADYSSKDAPVPGSLRDAVSGSNRTIVFRVGGTIHLKESLKITGSNLTIAGQTAPGDGITVADYTTSIEANNIIIRYMRFRLGDRVASEDDAFGSRYHKDIIIDHSSFSWSVDEVVSLYDNENTTVQWSISAESMLMTTHQKGRHGYGGIWGGKNASYHHNLIAHSVSRNPRLPTITRLADLTEMTNNVIYNWGFASTYGGGAEGYLYNLTNNYYKYGPNTYSSVKRQLFGELAPVTQLYLAGNMMDGSPEVTTDNWKGVLRYSDSSKLAEPAVMPNPYTAESADEAYLNVLADAGATLPRRDAYDARVISDVKNRTGQHINSPAEIGGYPDYPETSSAVTDADHDGMDDTWELAHGLSPTDPDDRNQAELSPEGYTNLEVYLNGLIGSAAADGMHTDNPETAVNYPLNNQIVEAGSDVTVEASASDRDGIAKVEFIINGVKQGEATEAPYSFAWNHVQDGTYYLVVQATDNKGLKTQSDNVAVHVNTSGDTGPWTSQDIGHPGIAGHTELGLQSGEITVKSSGLVGATSESESAADNFQFAYQPLKGNGEIIAKIESVTPTDDYAKAGVMIRDSLDDNAKMAMLAIPYVKYGKKGVLITRSATGAKVVKKEPGNFISTPYWVKLVRLGDEITGLVSPDKTTWSKMGTVSLDLGDTAYFGLAADAAQADNQVSRYNTSRFSGVELKTLDERYPSAPSGLKATAGSSAKIRLSWEKTKFAESYTVKRSEVPGGPYSTIAAGLAETRYTDSGTSPGKTYYYVVSAVNESGESFDSAEAGAKALADGGNIYYVEEDYEQAALDIPPDYYEIAPDPQTDTQKVAVSATPSMSMGNGSQRVLGVYDTGSGNVQFVRKFTPVAGALVIEADFMFAAESGTSVLLQAQNADGSKTAFSLESRKPTLPAAGSKYTLTVSRGSSQYHQLMNSYSLGQWYNLKLKADVQGSKVDIYIDNQPAGSFPFTTANFGSYGIGRILSKTPGGGSGNYYFDNLKVYAEPVETPLGLTGFPGNGAAQLKWPALGGAAAYNVKRSLTSGGPYDLIASSIAELSYVDAAIVNDTTYYYVITAAGPAGESGISNEVSITPSASALKLPAPEGLAAVSRNAQLDLSWSAVDDAAGYAIKRWNEAAGSYETLADNIAGTAYRIGGLVNGQRYRFTVSGTNVAGEGAASEPVEAFPAAPPGTPKVVALAGDSTVALTWAAANGADRYTVTRALSASGPYEILAAGIASTSYTDNRAANGTPYYYKVSAAGAGGSGLDSAAVAAVPYKENGQPPAPQGLMAEPGSGEVSLSWNPAEGAVSYRIIRAENGGPYAVVADGIKAAAYTDTGLRNGTTYVYAVIALGSGAGSLPSQAVQETPAQAIVVDAAGAGDFKTLAEAVQAVPDYSGLPTVIKVMDGIYREKVLVPASKQHLRIIGSSREGTVLVNGDSAKTLGADGKELGTSGSYTLRAAGADFTLENMTVENSAGRDAGQAVALYAEGDRGVYRNVKLLGHQDTLFADKGRAYFVDSLIEGTVDFIFGNAAAVFENNEIRSVGAGYITAPSTEAGKPGYVFLNSRLTASAQVAPGTVDLGRPWRDYGSSTFIHTDMAEHIRPTGWHEWYEGRSKTARFSEYLSIGAGADAAARYNWSRQLTAGEAAAYAVQSVLGGSDGWNPQTPVVVPGAEDVPVSRVTSITVKGADNISAIEADKGTLQLQAEVLPKQAANRNVVWTVTETDGLTSTAKAAIDQNGLLKARLNGTVRVTASAADGSGISASLDIAISGQQEAAADMPSATLTGPETVTAGEEFVYRAGLANVTASVYKDVYGVEFALDYDPTGIEFLSARKLVDGFELSHVSEGDPGHIVIRAAATGAEHAITAGAGFIELRFRARKTAKEVLAPLGFVAFRGYDGRQDYDIPYAAGIIVRVVPVPVKQIRVASTGEVSELFTGQTLQMLAEVQPPEAAGQTVVWSVRNGEGSSGARASITGGGLLTALSAGEVIVTAAAGSGSGTAGTLKLTIKNPDTASPPGTSAPAASPQEKKPPEATAGAAGIAITVTGNAGGKAAVELSSDVVRQAVGLIQEGTLRISMKLPADITAVELVLPAQELLKAASQGVRTVEADLGLTSFVIDSGLILKAAGSDAASIKLAAARMDSRQLAVQADNIGSAYELGFTVDGKPVDSFGGGLKVNLNYERPVHADADTVVAYCINEDGLEVVRNSAYHPLSGRVAFRPEHFSIYAAGYAEVAFTDLSGLAWAQDSIEALAARGVVQGPEPQAFRPKQNVTRAGFLKMLLLALDLPLSGGDSKFRDVAAGDWYYSYAAAAGQLGIVRGRTDGTFDADESITREEMALMAYRAAEQAGLQLQAAGPAPDYADSPQISVDALAAVQSMSGAGIIQGVGNDLYSPKAYASRAQAAVIVHRLFQKRP
ncbi:pectinesterase family protein [Paenibacillus graminis]|uniref:pectinesterase family protein n=1 Tax=Paenibacillus graminis TaxID=189425 RepID=UPI002DB685CF|nr:pectinesterase family protein [Paenibacillus graminis]MEC0167510.1 pectinesterase family protein [Paenibacillus graminis]